MNMVCSRCRQRANTGTPAVDSWNRIVCDRCAHNSTTDEMLIGIEQHQPDGAGRTYIKSRHGTIYHRKVIVWHHEAWFDGGATICPLTQDELDLCHTELGRIRVAIRLANEWAHGIRRCTECKARITEAEVAGYPLFAGLACHKCWEAHCAKLATMPTCTLCHQPRGACSC